MNHSAKNGLFEQFEIKVINIHLPLNFTSHIGIISIRPILQADLGSIKDVAYIYWKKMQKYKEQLPHFDDISIILRENDVEKKTNPNVIK